MNHRTRGVDRRQRLGAVLAGLVEPDGLDSVCRVVQRDRTDRRERRPQLLAHDAGRVSVRGRGSGRGRGRRHGGGRGERRRGDGRRHGGGARGLTGTARHDEQRRGKQDPSAPHGLTGHDLRLRPGLLTVESRAWRGARGADGGGRHRGPAALRAPLAGARRRRRGPGPRASGSASRASPPRGAPTRPTSASSPRPTRPTPPSPSAGRREDRTRALQGDRGHRGHRVYVGFVGSADGIDAVATSGCWRRSQDRFPARAPHDEGRTAARSRRARRGVRHRPRGRARGIALGDRLDLRIRRTRARAPPSTRPRDDRRHRHPAHRGRRRRDLGRRHRRAQPGVLRGAPGPGRRTRSATSTSPRAPTHASSSRRPSGRSGTSCSRPGPRSSSRSTRPCGRSSSCWSRSVCSCSA